MRIEHPLQPGLDAATLPLGLAYSKVSLDIGSAIIKMTVPNFTCCLPVTYDVSQTAGSIKQPAMLHFTASGQKFLA